MLLFLAVLLVAFYNDALPKIVVLIQCNATLRGTFWAVKYCSIKIAVCQGLTHRCECCDSKIKCVELLGVIVINCVVRSEHL